MRLEGGILHHKWCKIPVMIGELVNGWKSDVDEVANRWRRSERIGGVVTGRVEMGMAEWYMAAQSFKVSKFQGFRVNVKVKFEEPSFA